MSLDPRSVARDGLEHLGTITLGPTVVVGDPRLLGRRPPEGAFLSHPVRPGRWHLFGRADDGDPDRLAEIVLAHESLTGFWNAYDDARPIAELAAPSGRAAIGDAPLSDDADVLLTLLDPDLEALPWVQDRAVVADALGESIRVFSGRADLLAVAFGRAPTVPLDPPGTRFQATDDLGG